MSLSIYSLLKNKRLEENLTVTSVSSKTGISETTLEIIEAGELEKLQMPNHTIEAYMTRYADFLKLKNLPAYELPKRKTKKSSLSAFDYLIRLAIIVVLALLIYHVYLLVKDEQIKTVKITTNKPAEPHLNQAENTKPVGTNQVSTEAATPVVAKKVEITSEPNTTINNAQTQNAKSNDKVVSTQDNNQTAETQETVNIPQNNTTTSTTQSIPNTTANTQTSNHTPDHVQKAMENAIKNSSISG